MVLSLKAFVLNDDSERYKKSDAFQYFFTSFIFMFQTNVELLSASMW